MKLVNVCKVENLEVMVESILKDEKTTKSSKMKELFGLGLEVKEISEKMGVRYNFVYNVVSNVIIQEGLEVETKRSTSKRDMIKEMFMNGKTSKEISFELKTNINYVYKIVKEYKNSLEAKVEEIKVMEESKNVVEVVEEVKEEEVVTKKRGRKKNEVKSK